MNLCRQVGADVWIGLSQSPPPRSCLPAAQRWARDRLAADRAMAAVLEVTSFGLDACAISRSHTGGMGAALVAPAGVMVGVDLVATDRVTPRHAGVVLSGREWEALARYGSLRPALGWAVKEAAAKATGDPLSCFPLGLEIGQRQGRLTVRQLGRGGPEFGLGWGLFGQFLCAWVHSAGLD